MLEPSLANEAVSSPVHPGTGLTHEEIRKDFELCCISREASLIARKEVLTGKAKFGIIGDGKEVPQVSLARFFRPGDFRSGYYRDQTFHMALDLCSLEAFYAQLYADVENDPFSRGRQMNNHFATPLLDEKGEWTDHTQSYNISADISSTAGQMARALGLALASKKYRESPEEVQEGFSAKGDEVVFCTIGDASTSEGIFWETLNAAGVMQVPLAVLVWDDGYGISVPVDYQTTHGSISKATSGLQSEEGKTGIRIFEVKGWDYPALLQTYREAIEVCRQDHRPVLIHVQEVTQPQGHSTSGSHERYKSKERLAWEAEFDCVEKMADWVVSEKILSAEEVDEIRQAAKKSARAGKDNAWKAYNKPLSQTQKVLKSLLESLPQIQNPELTELMKELERMRHPQFYELVRQARRIQARYLALGYHQEVLPLRDWIVAQRQEGDTRYDTHLYSQSEQAALRVPIVPAKYAEDAPLKNGFEILNAFFDRALAEYPNLFAFGEDVGKIGDVNQGFAGLQKKYGESRVFDTGIREWTIMAQAIGMAMRGLRPIAEIQYLDYLIYGLEPLMDDLATLRWRSVGMQKAPAIIRTRGHRLEGIWHAGSPLGLILNALRGMHVLVPRNMTQAAGMYNTLLQGDDPALVIECLNGYRLKERLPENLGQFTVPLGVPEVLQPGTDITLVTYGSCVRIAQEGIDLLEKQGISVELIDVQTLLPFDLENRILASVQKTNRLLLLDEDVPGGASAYMMREILERQGAYRYLDSMPTTLTAKAHRPPYGSDGDYFTKPSAEDVFETVYRIMGEAEPERFPARFS
jgi:pyruvate/2-oxoglutarate/acetoin dehydrogenase E1 component/TPP-dependent pyruvate/acetoin dehydrogenase alpha subunit